MASFVALAPFPVLPHAGFEHLVGVEVGVLAQDRVRQRGDQPIGRMIERQIASDEAAGIAHRSLSIERREKCRAQSLVIAWQVVEPVVGRTG